MKNYLKISTFIAFGLLLFGVIGLTAAGGLDKSERALSIFSKAEYQLSEEIYITDYNSNYNLLIDSSNTEVEVKIGPKFLIQSYYYNEDDILNIDVNQTTAEITEEKWYLNIFNGCIFCQRGSKIIVSVPEDIILDTNITVANGKFDFQELTMSKLKMKLTNGDVMLADNIILDVVDIKLTNGDIKIANMTLEKEMTISNVNGDIEFDNTNGTLFTAKTVNGEIAGTNYTGTELLFETTNGGIEVYDIYAKDVTLETVNGSLFLSNSNFEYVIEKLDAKTVNGEKDIIANYRR